ncbi:ABC transporter ATP-binding protein [Microbacterium esteraromaticum]|uniref:ABC transporter ATP-binding protein n=1 Tax=Microbacterium esteraromaticum TaxID=57043 RepID=UPI0031FCAE36
MHRIGAQVVEAGGVHRRLRPDAARARALTALQSAGLVNAESRFRQYPHELSGGMKQRALIAMGTINRPRLLIADEPTSALDVTVQRVILDNLDQLVAEAGTAVILVTHDLGLAADRADRVLVMHRGRVVEHGDSRGVLIAPQADYTRALVAAAPANRSGDGAPLPDPSAPVILSVAHLGKTYPARGHGRRRTEPVHAVDDVSFAVRRGQTLAIVGESGSGRSTAASIALKLLEPTTGDVRFDGEDVTALKGRELLAYRRRVQPIFQDPYASLDPMATIGQILTEPLRAFRIGDAASRRVRVRELLEMVRLPQDIIERSPNELSGGQRQRVAIARALAPEPELIVCDEPVSALDVLVQANVLEVMQRIQQELGVAYLFISHDLGVVEQIAHDVVVMSGGRVVEAGPTRDVFSNPQAAYTRELLEAVPGRAVLVGHRSS